MTGFSAKLDNGKVAELANGTPESLTTWEVLGGPIIGFYMKKSDREKGGMSELGFIVGDVCSPKYLLAQILNLILGEKRVLKFYWQDSYQDYFKICVRKGLIAVSNP